MPLVRMFQTYVTLCINVCLLSLGGAPVCPSLNLPLQGMAKTSWQISLVSRATPHVSKCSMIGLLWSKFLWFRELESCTEMHCDSPEFVWCTSVYVDISCEHVSMSPVV